MSRLTLPDEDGALTDLPADATIADRVRSQLALLRLTGGCDPRVLALAERFFSLYQKWDPTMAPLDGREWLRLAMEGAEEIVRQADAG